MAGRTSGVHGERTGVRRSWLPVGIPSSTSRRSAGPPRAGSGAATPRNASSARVAPRLRGTASWDTVTRTSRGAGGRARRTSTRAAPAATPRTRPMARNVNSLTVTKPASPASSPPVRKDPSAGQRSCALWGRQLRGTSPCATGTLCSPGDAGGRFRRVGDLADPPSAPEPDNTERSVLAWPSIQPRNSSSNLSTRPGCSATSSARKRVRWGPIAAAT